MQYAARVGAVLVASLLGLAGCGGGGGGGSESGSGSGSTQKPKLVVTPTRIDVTALTTDTSGPTANLTLTLQNGSLANTYIGAGTTTNGVEGLSFSASQPVLTVGFKDPRTLEAGTYTDTVRVAICVDSNCTTIQSGSEVSVPVTYVVGLGATASLAASTTTTGAGIPVTLTWSSTDAQSCTATGAWSGTLPASGSRDVTPPTVGTHTYSVNCANPGVAAQASVTITAEAPTAALTVFPRTVVVGKPVTLRWESRYATSCVASGDWTGSLAPAGFRTLPQASSGTAQFRVVCVNNTASAPADASVVITAAPVSPPATAYRMNESHDGVLVTSNGMQYPAGSAPAWTRDLGAPVSYPLIVNGRVFVATANPGGTYGNRLYALDAHTGAILWGPVSVPGTYFGSGLSYENGRVFILMFDGVLRAFNASNGAPVWATQMPGYWFFGSPNAYGGIVFAAGNYGLNAVDAADGTVLWSAGSGGTTGWTSPAVSSEGAFIQDGYNCGAGAYDPLVGTTLWRSSSPCDTPWGYSTSVRDGVVYGRAGQSLNLFDATSGAFAVQLGSQAAPAITATSMIALNTGILSSTRLSDRAQAWSFAGAPADDGGLVTSPVVVNQTVFVGAASGKVYGLDVATGATVWTGTSPVGLAAEIYNGNPGPPSGPAAGEDKLIFTAGSTLVAWQLQ